MKIGFIISNFPFERRVAIMPGQVRESNNEIVIERGFGATMDIPDAEYQSAGATLMSRDDIFATCDVLFSLKLIQPNDYDKIRKGQVIAGWIHPTGSGKEFVKSQADPKGLVIIDLDNIYPSVYYKGNVYQIPFIHPNFIRQNSVFAGRAAVMHALMSYGYWPDSNSHIAILSAGNVAQGAFETVSKWNADVRMFYRKTLSDFYNTISKYDIIINGIEIDDKEKHILTKEQLTLVKPGCLIIDAAADAEHAIEGTHYTTLGNPFCKLGNTTVYCVNNSPSVFYRSLSETISKSFAEVFYNKQIESFLELIHNK
mgnify:CR=1 FL=1